MTLTLMINYLCNLIQVPLGKSISISKSGSYGTSGMLDCASVSEFFVRSEPIMSVSIITPVKKQYFSRTQTFKNLNNIYTQSTKERNTKPS